MNRLNRKSGLFAVQWVLVAIMTGGVLPFANEASARPNIVVFLADDQGWGDVGINGNPWLKTPHIDSLAHDGVLFERFYVQPVCAPTRAEFLTGRYHPRGGVGGVSRGEERLDRDELTIADALRSAGYTTGLFGKWHNGTQWPYHPNARGFEDFYGYTSGHWGSYFDPLLDQNGEWVQGRGFLTDDLTDHTLRFIDTSLAAGRPFFAVLAFNTPHSPMQVPNAYWDRYAGVDPTGTAHRYRDRVRPDHARAAMAMCANLDDNVGRVLRHLDDHGVGDETIVVYFSDNGPNGWRWNDNLRGRKGSTDVGGVRSLLHVRWPGHVSPGRRLGPLVGAIDLMPTLLDLANVSAPSEQTRDGRSFARWLLDDELPHWADDRALFAQWNGQTSVITAEYILAADDGLFDLKVDPGQFRDLRNERPDVVKDLRQRRRTWLAEMETESRDARTFPVGANPGFPTQLPARDAEAQGEISRSARPPNCSYFTNWKRIEDVITWEIAVERAGTYVVEVYYACKEVDVGATMELTAGDARLTALLQVAHEPSLHGPERDRYPRVESAVKSFRPWRMGQIDLAAGQATLALRASDIPGREAMEMRMVVLRYLAEK